MFLLQKYEIFNNYQLNFYRQKQNVLSAKLSLTAPPYEGALPTALIIIFNNKHIYQNNP